MIKYPSGYKKLRIKTFKMRPSAIDYSSEGTMFQAALYGMLDDDTIREHRVELLEALQEYTGSSGHFFPSKRLIDVAENDILNDNIDR